MSIATNAHLYIQRLPHVAIYTRVSTEEQVKNGESVGVQEALCLEQCTKAFGENLFTHEVITDQGKSGCLGPIPNDPRPNKRKRKGLEGLITAIEADRFTHLCAFKIDRLYRNLIGWLRFKELCDEREVCVFFVAEKYDESIGGQLAAGVVAQVAEYIRKQAVDNVQYALDARKNEGYWTGTPPFGWRYQTEPECGEQRPSIVQVPERITLLKRINEMFVSGRSFQEIARILNVEGTPQRRAVGRWQAVTVRSALIHHAHAGLIRLKNGELKEGQHYADRLWDPSHYDTLCEIVRRRRKKFKGVAATQPSRLFAGLATCGTCGRKLRSEFASNTPCYRCLGKLGDRSHVYVSAKFLEGAVLGEVKNLALQPAVIKAARAEVVQQVEREQHSVAEERESLQKKLSHFRLRKSKLLDALSNGAITQIDYRGKASEIESEYAELSRRFDDITERLKSMVSDTSFRERALSTLSSLESVWNALEDHERRELIHTVVESLAICLEDDRLFLKLKLCGLPASEVPVLRGRFNWAPTKPVGPDGLTPRELACLKHLGDGLKMTAIAELMGVRVEQVYRLRDHAKRCLGVDSYAAAVDASREKIDLYLSVLPLFGKRNGTFKPNPALSVMEYQVLGWRASGLTCDDIAKQRDAFPDTVSELEARALAKTGYTDPCEALRAAIARGQIPKHLRENSTRLDRRHKG
jgi:DNA invertase Pin-like site-specific DNA recombinase/DNA-binding NarL/FixJ family response regulator